MNSTIYEKVGRVILRGGFIEVFRVKILSLEPGDKPDNQTKPEPPEQEKVGKGISRKVSSASIKQWLRATQENEHGTVMNYPSVSFSLLLSQISLPDTIGFTLVSH